MSADLRALWRAAGGNVPDHWTFQTIEELLESQKSISVGVMYPGSNVLGGTPLIRVSDVKNGAIAKKPDFCISSEVDQEYRRTKLFGSELLITLVGNPGDCVIVTEEMIGWNAARALAVLKLKDPDLRRWLRYVLLSKPAKHLIDARLNTTVQKTLNLKDIRELGIPIPPKEERYKITNVIDAIENKMLLNTQTNQTLESIAQAIFKSWFVDFEPVKAKMAVLESGGSGEQAELAAMSVISGKSEAELAQLQQQNPEHYQQLTETATLFPSAMVESELGEIPEGWEVGTYDQIIEFNPKRSIKKGQLAPYLDMQNVPTSGHCANDIILREMNSGTKFINGDTLLARITPCLENGKTAFVDFLKSDETGWGSTEFIVMRMKDDIPPSISYFIARQESFRNVAIQSMTGTSGRQRAEAKVIGACSAVIPPKKLLIKFGKISDKHLTLASANHQESKSLAELRDSLLPKLLSGEIDLTNVQSEVA
jgi:type I restriction enzyme S subunit